MAKCPGCQTQNPARAKTCSSCGADLLAINDAVPDDEDELAQPVEVPAYMSSSVAEESPHQSFARRLFNSATSTAPAPEEVATRATPPAAEMQPRAPHRVFERRYFEPPEFSAPIRARPARPSEALSSTPRADEHALRELQRQAAITHAVSLLVQAICLLVFAASVGGFFVALALDAGERTLGIIGAAAGFGLLGFFGVVFSPLADRQRRLAVLIAQTQVAGMALSHNFELWETYLGSRVGQLSAAEIEMAVRSLSLSSQTIAGSISDESALETAPRPVSSQPSREGPAYNPTVAAKY
jgi:hypothetical protein